MYIQTARYVLKNYATHLTKPEKPLADSVKYIKQFDSLAQTTLGDDPWTIKQLLTVMIRALQHLI